MKARAHGYSSALKYVEDRHCTKAKVISPMPKLSITDLQSKTFSEFSLKAQFCYERNITIG